MGIEHRTRVYSVPVGYLHADERLVLLVLADGTNDARVEWGHDRDDLRRKLGGVSDEWLRIRLRDLDDAGWITRRPQRRDERGGWRRQLIRLELTHIIDNGQWEHVRPTRRSVDRRKAHLEQHRNDARDAAGKWASH